MDLNKHMLTKKNEKEQQNMKLIGDYGHVCFIIIGDSNMQ